MFFMLVGLFESKENLSRVKEKWLSQSPIWTICMKKKKYLFRVKTSHFFIHRTSWLSWTCRPRKAPIQPAWCVYIESSSSSLELDMCHLERERFTYELICLWIGWLKWTRFNIVLLTSLTSHINRGRKESLLTLDLVDPIIIHLY